MDIYCIGLKEYPAVAEVSDPEIAGLSACASEFSTNIDDLIQVLKPDAIGLGQAVPIVAACIALPQPQPLLFQVRALLAQEYP